jgi:glycosyltransferase involved in cell wall biosynthesis
MYQQELVSVIIPVYNRPERLKEAVMSVLLQDYSNIEIIIIDDGSTDSTSKVIQVLSIKWNRSIVYQWQANRGPGAARELGTEKAQGVYIQYLDSDDILIDKKITTQVKAFQSNTEGDICYGMSYQEDHAFEPPLLTGPIRETGREINRLFPLLLNERWWTTSSPLYKSELIRRIGPWLNLINEEDWEFDARAGQYKAVLIWCAAVVSVRRINLSTDHLSYGGSNNPIKLRDRIIAKQRIYISGLKAGVKTTDHEMKLFSRECFLLARQCAEAGLEDESKNIFKLSRLAADRIRRYGIDFLLYACLGRIVGWRRVGKGASKLRSVLKFN